MKKILDIQVTDEPGIKTITVGSHDGELHWYGGTPAGENSRSIGPGEFLSVWSQNDGEYSEITTINYFGASDDERAEAIRTAAKAAGIKVGI